MQYNIQINLNGVILNNKNRAILYGLSLGDGHVFVRNRLNKGKYKYVSAGIMLGHSHKQKAYLIYKRNLLHSILGGKLNKVVEYDHVVQGKVYMQCRVQKTDKYFRIVHNDLYSRGKKFISRQFLNKLSPHALAIWYMDDGSCHANTNKNGKITSCQISIATYCSEIEVDNIINYFFDTYNIHVKKSKDKRMQNGWHIRMNTTNSKKFISLIRQYLHSSMLYKITALDRLD